MSNIENLLFTHTIATFSEMLFLIPTYEKPNTDSKSDKKGTWFAVNVLLYEQMIWFN